VTRDFEQYPVPAVDAVAKKARVNPAASVYLARSLGKIIVAPTVASPGGLYVDCDPSAVLSWDVDVGTLGQHVWEALLAFRNAPAPVRKLTDWPAYRASGARSVRDFRARSVQVSVEAVACLLRLEAGVPVPAADGLFIGQYITTSCEFTDLGDLLFLLHRCAEHIATYEYG
jgi:hypothetical protein